MTENLTLSQVREAARILAEAEPGTIVTRCVYADEAEFTTPVCIVGRILAELQPETFARFNPDSPEYMNRDKYNVTANHCSIRGLFVEFDLPLDVEAVRYLEMLQEAQDDHVPKVPKHWGSAFAYAEEQVEA